MSDASDQKQAIRIGVGLLVLLAIGGLVLLASMDDLAAFNTAHLAPGLDLREAAKYALGITLGLIVVFAIASGDGFGELIWILAGFFCFFVINTALIAWIF
jgi:hypothetical protein